MNTYSSIGGEIYPQIDSRAFPFSADLGVPVTVKEQRYENIPTISSLSQATSLAGAMTRLEFQVQANSDGSMYDLHNSYFQLTMTIPALGGNQGLSAFACDSVVNQCDVYFGSVLVSEPHSGGVYPIQSFVKDAMTAKRPFSLATTSCDVSEDALEEGQYVGYPLTTTQTADGAMPVALAFTKAWITNQTINLSLRLKDGVFLTSKYFPSNVPLRIVMVLNLQNLFQENPGVATISAGGCVLSNIQFLLNRVYLSDDSLKAQSSALLSNPFSYVLPYSKCETRQLAQGQSIFNFTGLFQGQTRPDLLVVLFQQTLDKSWPRVACGSVFGGSQGGVVTQLYSRFNGVQHPSPTCFPLATDIRTYREYAKNCLQDQDDVFLDYARWDQQYTLYVINLRDDQAKTFGLAPSTECGNVDIYAQFTTALAAPMTMYVVGLTHARIEIDSRGLVSKFGYIN